MDIKPEQIVAKRSARDKPTSAQVYNLNKFQRANGRVFVSHDPEAQEVVEWIHAISRR